VAQLVLLSGAEVGEQLGEEALGPLLVHLLEFGHPSIIHLLFLL
jgi:hypothetical protein